MIKFTVSHYRKDGSNWFLNGGKLLVTEQGFSLRYFFHTVARFEKNRTTVRKVEDLNQFKGFCFFDDVQSFTLYFLSKTADELCQTLNIE